MSTPVFLRFGGALASAAFALLALAAPPVAAGSIDVRGDDLAFAEEGEEGEVWIFNYGSGPARVDVTPLAWSQSGGGGEGVLTGTRDLRVRNPSFELAPGERARVGVRAEASPGDVERAYRLRVEARPAGGAGEGSERSFAIPAFIGPSEARRDVRVREVQARGGGIDFSVENRGDAHIRPRAVQVAARDANGDEALRARLEGAYILPGARRSYTLTLDGARCEDLAEVEIRVEGAGGAWSLRRPASLAGCLDP